MDDDIPYLLLTPGPLTTSRTVRRAMLRDLYMTDFKARRFVIYPGKVTDTETFRIGTIGHVFRDDIDQLLGAIQDVRDEMGFEP